MRRLRWDAPSGDDLPKRPYRDAVLVYGGMSAVVVVIALLTGGGFVKALVIAGLFFVVATLWSWRNLRNRLRAARRKP